MDEKSLEKPLIEENNEEKYPELKLKVSLQIPMDWDPSPLTPFDPDVNLIDYQPKISVNITSKSSIDKLRKSTKSIYLTSFLLLAISIIASIFTSSLNHSSFEVDLPDFTIFLYCFYLFFIVSIILSILILKRIIVHLLTHISKYEVLSLVLFSLFMINASVYIGELSLNAWEIARIYSLRFFIIGVIIAFSKCSENKLIRLITSLLLAVLEVAVNLAIDINISSLIYLGISIFANMIAYRLLDKFKILQESEVLRRRFAFLTLMCSIVINGVIVRYLLEISIKLNQLVK